VYLDTLFQIFVFVPVSVSAPAISGTLLDGQNKPSGAGVEVTLVKDGIKYQTFTNSKSEFKFFGDITGPFTLQSAITARAISKFTSLPRNRVILRATE
jgi:hypothetical protein